MEEEKKVQSGAAPEEAPAEPEKKPELKYSDEDLDRIIAEKYARFQREADKKINERIDQAQKLAAMDERQRIEYERDALQQELDELREEKARNEMAKTARGMLSEKGITVADDLLAVLVSDDADATKAAVDAFAGLFQSAVEQAVKDKLRGTTPKTGEKPTITREQILAIEDPKARQAAIRDNIELFD